MSAYQPKTGAQCGCRRGVQRDNCPHCEGTGMVIDFKAIRARGYYRQSTGSASPTGLALHHSGEEMSMEKKITIQDGRYTILTTRDQEHRFGDKIKHISSTEAQPYIAVNFDATGICVGGRTMQASAAKLLIDKAAMAGWKIEEVAE